MTRIARWAFVLSVAIVLAVGVVFGFKYLSASISDPCSDEFQRCAADATGWAEQADCRLEIYHCRSMGEFHHPDGTVVKVPPPDVR